MKIKYIAPNFELISLKTLDIITSSSIGKLESHFVGNPDNADVYSIGEEFWL